MTETGDPYDAHTNARLALDRLRTTPPSPSSYRNHHPGSYLTAITEHERDTADLATIRAALDLLYALATKEQTTP